jgi:hypothetical protein
MEPNHRTQHEYHEIVSSELKSLVMGLLNGHMRSLSIDVSERGIVLRGVCDSFHAKQLVQEIVTKSSSLRILSNELVVNEFRSSFAPSGQSDRKVDEH